MKDSAVTINMADIYRFLALSMHYPDPAWLNDEYFSLLSLFLDELGWQEERAAIEPLMTGTADALEALQVEHTRLFINAVPHVLAPPYGSIYLDSSGVFYGVSAEKTRSFYREKGCDLAVADDIPDSLVSELQFLAFLLQHGQEADEQLFLRQLFRPWFTRFRERVQQEARHPFYGVVVRMIDFFTMEDE
ncbi:MAG: molecular chaperone TorD family protein [Desulfobulbaceae bacterium]|nr:molecular chaperone TorD family protein [Desulfobulbaceae bacterium]